MPQDNFPLVYFTWEISPNSFQVTQQDRNIYHILNRENIPILESLEIYVYREILTFYKCVHYVCDQYVDCSMAW